MTFNFGDGFDLYAATTDAGNGYWDVGGNYASAALVSGRFPGSRAWNVLNANNTELIKSSGVNDAVHHIVVAFQQAGTIAGGGLGSFIQLLDGATAQCTLQFRQDGAILLLSGGTGGATLATYTGAFPLASTWYGFEFEVVINNTTGSFTVRKNGNTVAEFTATGLNTRGGTANNYANKIAIGEAASNLNSHVFDDFFWQSGAATGTWLGELRCVTRMPASTVSAQFTPAGARTTSSPGGSNIGISANSPEYTTFTMPCDGAVNTWTLTGGTNAGNFKAAMYADNAGVPGAVLASASNVIASPAGAMSYTFSPPVSVTNGQKIWMGFCGDTTFGTINGSTTNIGFSGSTAYASFPVANPAGLTANRGVNSTVTVAPTNAFEVNEAQQDAFATYVFDSNPGDADFYGIAASPSVPAATVAVITRAYMQKSDVGTRTAAVQVKSGATIAASPTLTLTTSGWQWTWRTDLTDPNTGAAWAAAAVNALQVGPTVVA